MRALTEALHADGLKVSPDVDTPTFARLTATDPSNGVTARVELGVDWRGYPPTVMEIGPVLHADDAVANKVCALYGRGAVRDYIDVDGIVQSGRYSIPRLLALAVGHDPGFDAGLFAEALAAVGRFPPAAFAPYGLSPDETDALTARILDYAGQVRGHAE